MKHLHLITVGALSAFLASTVPTVAQFSGQLPPATVLGNATASKAPATPIASSNGTILITGGAISARTFDSTYSGIVPLSGGGTANFLRADGSWTTPTGTCTPPAAGAVMFSSAGPVCSGNQPQFSWDNTGFKLSITALPGIGVDNGQGIDLIGGNNSRGGAQRIRQSALGGSLRLGYADGNTQSYIYSLDGTNTPNHLSLNYAGGTVSVGSDLDTLVNQPAYSALMSDSGGASKYAAAWGSGGDWRGGVFMNASGKVSMRLFATGGTEQVHLSADSTETSFVPGEFQAGGTLSCNGTNSAVQTNSSGKFVCGSISGGGGGVTSVALSVPATSIFGVTGSPVTTTGTLGLTTTGTSGGIPYFSSGTQLSTSTALTANLPVIGGGAGVAPSVGTRSGNTTAFVTTTGTQTSGNIVSIDASGNHVASGTTASSLPSLSGNNTWTGTQTFGTVLGTVSTQSGTSYTLASTDCGTMVKFTNAAAVAVTAPASLGAGCHIALMQTTAGGQITVAAGGGATFSANPHSYTKSFGQNAIIGVTYYDTSSFTLVGDGA